VSFNAVHVQSYQSRSPLDFEILGQRLLIVPSPHSDHIGVDKFDDRFVWIRNCIHFLATDSVGIEEVKEYGLVLRFRSLERGPHVSEPLNFGRFLFLRLRAHSHKSGGAENQQRHEY
jgi:hypothetical protein